MIDSKTFIGDAVPYTYIVSEFAAKSDLTWTTISGKPTLFSGNYDDITHEPSFITILQGSQGDKGDTGPQGPIGLVGPIGPVRHVGPT